MILLILAAVSCLILCLVNINSIIFVIGKSAAFIFHKFEGSYRSKIAYISAFASG